MMIFIPVFFPAFLCVVLREYFSCDKHSKLYLLTSYLTALFLINFIVVAVACYGFGSKGNIVDNLNQYSEFWIHYCLLAFIIAVLEPLVEYRCLMITVTSSTPNSFSFTHQDIGRYILYFLTLLFFLLNAMRCFDNVIWGDEGFSVRLAQMDFMSMIASTASDVHPPLYYIILQLFCRLFGHSITMYHMVSLLSYTFILILGVTIIKKHFGICAASIFISFASLLDSAIIYNLEIRMYSLAELLVLLTFLQLYALLKNPKWINYMLFALFALAAAYTHYYALLSVGFLYIFLLIYVICKRKEDIKKLLTLYTITFLGYLPWLMIFIKCFRQVTNDWWLNYIPSFKDSILYLFSSDKLQNVWIIIFIGSLCIAFFNRQDNIRITFNRVTRRFMATLTSGKLVLNAELLWIISGIFSIAGTIITGIAVSEIMHPVFILRYVFPVSSIGWLILSVCISKCKRRQLWSTGIILLLLYSGLPQLTNTMRQERIMNESTLETLHMTDEISEDDFIITDILHLNWTLLEHYYPNVNHQYNKAFPDDMVEKNNTYIFWSQELDETVLNIKYIGQGYLGTSYVYIYQTETPV